jgi:cation diffusion facilitator CzcD-associated flavoprotein CzcO
MATSRRARGEMRIAIIGGGLGGIAMAVKLQAAGYRDLQIFEKSDRAGGTWSANTYPGAACDVPSNFYSYSFRFRSWPRLHATQPEILDYIDDVVDHYGLRDSIRLGTAVRRAVWDDEEGGYQVESEAGPEGRFDVVVSAVGMLNVPNIPAWPGLDSFRGAAFHSSQWRHDVDLAGKRVAVVGTGSSAAQIVPAIAGTARRVTVFQRQPGWVLPKDERELSAEEMAFYSRPANVRRARFKALFARHTFGSAKADSARNRAQEHAARAYLDRAVRDPATRAALTPDYTYGCKRVVLSSDFLPAFNRPDVALVPRSVTRVTATGIVDDAGVETPVDMIVMATGFQATRYLSTVEIVGPGGRELHEAWGLDPEAFLGVSYPGFPNFFMLYGPNSNSATSSIIFILEAQAQHIARQVRRLDHSGAVGIEVRRSLHDRFNAWVQRAASSSRWTAGCNNYQLSATGRVVTNWPFHAALYWVLTKVPVRAASRLVGVAGS